LDKFLQAIKRGWPVHSNHMDMPTIKQIANHDKSN
jgi:hypothetical protein